MCKIYNTIGSLSTVKAHLLHHNINEFNSLNEVINFQKNFTSNRLQIISNQEHLIEVEKNRLALDISQLDNSIGAQKIEIENIIRNEIEKLEQDLRDLVLKQSNLIQRLFNYLKAWSFKKKIQLKKNHFDSNVNYSLRELVRTHADKKDRYQYIVSHRTEAIAESGLLPLRELDRKKRIIDEVNNSIYGALGEQKVVKELENLSDEYFLINDFCLSFPKPIYNRQENDYIKSIQIDHVLITNSGVFLIETKNWSDKTLNNLNLRSPVDQIRRTSFAVFKILADQFANTGLNLNQHHWGKRKVPIRNLIVLINSKPKEEFQYVKILTLDELIGYIKYFKPTFSMGETQDIADFFIRLTDRK